MQRVLRQGTHLTHGITAVIAGAQRVGLGPAGIGQRVGNVAAVAAVHGSAEMEKSQMEANEDLER